MTIARDPAAGFYWDQTEDRADMCGPGLRIAFARTGAVWTHSLVLPREDGLEIARAVETDPERDHPGRVVSPVYQEIQRHQNAAWLRPVSPVDRHALSSTTSRR